MKKLLPFLFVFASVQAAPEPIFNGKDLTGWKGTGYVVKDGTIVCTPKGGNLITEKEYSNYVFSFEFKLPPGGNNGIAIHYPGKGNPSLTGMEIQVLDDTATKYKNLKPYQFHAGIYTLKEAKHGHLKPVGEWNKETITVNGNHVIVELNGVIVNEGNLDDLAAKHPEHKGVKRRKGHIGFCGHKDPVAFRNISIVDTTLPEVDLTGFSKLYNGKDLSGWSQDKGHVGHWQPRGDVLYYDSKSTAKDKNLWTEKSYGDFTFVADWRWAETSTRLLMRPELDTTTGGTKKDANGKLLPEYNWVWSPQGVINMHEPEKWGYVYFSSKKAGVKDNFTIANDEKIKWELYKIYRAQKQYFKANKSWATSIKKIATSAIVIDDKTIQPVLENYTFGFIISVKSPFSDKLLVIKEDGKFISI